ncbi:glycosyltransferase [Aliikangiella marina]|uniref:Glycosyltransferase n=1 Tax=Aliikangiella marina TaxID=1712262 RepID=A0A545TBM3_9GAMM|nr:glycosyltransferase family A protein [Aliikangiella marina]TQV74596.1 glycosyltransferase [Aliikangiella marina]
MDKPNFNHLGIVVIGRNEGERLRRCLESVINSGATIVYVDSGSSDGSIELAKNLGVGAIALDDSKPFSAARARNEGVEYLVSLDQGIEFVQFIDGDCELFPRWLELGINYLMDNDETVIVCGYLHERYPEASIYNRFCDLEWDTYVGDLHSCGGIFMVRLNAFSAVGGFNGAVIAGEEPELCKRLRANGGKVVRVAVDMAYHDSAMLHFSQWWKRGVRNGYGGMEILFKYKVGGSIKSALSIGIWGGLLPASIIASWLLSSGWILLVNLIYPLKAFQIARRMSHLAEKRAGDPWIYSLSCMTGKFPEAFGQIKYFISALLKKPSGVISHK